MPDIAKAALYAPDGSLVATGEHRQILSAIQGSSVGMNQALHYLLGGDARLEGAGSVRPADVLKVAETLEFISRKGCLPGFFTTLPAGNLLEDCLSAFNRRQLDAIGAQEIAFPVVFDNSPQDTASMTESYEKDGRMFRIDDADAAARLSYAADPGLFSFLRSRTIDSDLLPYAIYSPHQALRRWKRGELTGLDRTRQYLLRDPHILVNKESSVDFWHDLMEVTAEGARWWFEEDWCVFIDATIGFLSENPDLGLRTARKTGQWTLLNHTSGQSRYFAMRSGIMVDSGYDALMLYNTQWDVDNVKRYDVRGTGGDVAVVHATAVTGCSRMLPIMIGRALAGKRGQVLPIEFAPVQVAVLPVSEAAASFGRRVAADLEALGFRTSLVPASGSIGKRISKLRAAWIPAVVLVGEKEVAGAEPTVRSLADDSSTNLSRFTREIKGRLERCTPSRNRYVPLPLVAPTQPQNISRNVR